MKKPSLIVSLVPVILLVTIIFTLLDLRGSGYRRPFTIHAVIRCDNYLCHSEFSYGLTGRMPKNPCSPI